MWNADQGGGCVAGTPHQDRRSSQMRLAKNAPGYGNHRRKHEKQQKEALFDLTGRLLDKQFLIPGCFFKGGQDREDRDREQN